MLKLYLVLIPVLACLPLGMVAGCGSKEEELTEIQVSKMNEINHSLKCIVVKKERVKNVAILDDGKKINVTDFKKPQRIYAYEISNDGKYLLVWHMERSPRKISIYDIKTCKLVSRFVPGYGGQISWTNGNNLIHWWGAGTSARCFAAYDINGKELYRGYASGFDVDPTRRVYITFPTAYGALPFLKVYDIETGKKLYRSESKLDIRMHKDILWKKNELVLLYYDSKTAGRELRLKLRLSK